MRRGSRTAASPPGRRNGRRRASRKKLPAVVALAAADTAAARDQGLASPDGAVRAVAGAVETESERRTGHSIARAVLGETAGEMGVVMLHRDQRQRPRRPSGALEQAARGARRARCPVRRRIVGMEIVHDRYRRRSVKVEKVENDALESGVRLRSLHVAQMLREEDLVADAQRGGRLLMRSRGDQARQLAPGEQRQRRVATGPAQQLRRAVGEPGDAVVDMAGDRPVVEEKEVGDCAQANESLAVVDGDRLVGEVAARRHQREVGLGEQQVVQRARRQHHSEAGISRRELRRQGERGQLAALQEDDRRLRRGEESGLLRRDPAEVAGRADIAHHQRQRFRRPLLARPQRGDGGRGARVAEQLEAADPLDRGDLAAGERRRDIRERRRAFGAQFTRGGRRAQLRPALGTGVRLGVEAAAGRVFILAAAGRAEREAAHRRRRAVVRQAEHDGEARPAVGAVGERIVEAAVCRRKELASALGAGREIG